ncbi:MAG TPA: [Fe-S]-binding protein, partial [Candidatus Latescibacteria bacterium]|nr:[Fe-S]-binding protein [Candidatus Latescibacterota bacterium]
MSFPEMARFRQRFDAEALDDVVGTVNEQLHACDLAERIQQGQRIAITGGSRG